MSAKDHIHLEVVLVLAALVLVLVLLRLSEPHLAALLLRIVDFNEEA